MIKIKENIIPWIDESPTSYADRIGILYSAVRSDEFKKKNGQFFTPPDISHFMSSLSDFKGDDVKILDPGTGIGILSLSLIETLVTNNKKIKKIELVAYETDSKLINYTQESFSYLKKWLKNRKIKFDYILRANDYISDNKYVLNGKENVGIYDIVISNPPYFKLSNSDERVKSVKQIIHGQANIYSLFLYLSARLLKNNGELIFIIPRSFTSGLYFKAFREKFFEMISLKKIHIFGSRKLAFNRDEVLLENIIIQGVKNNNLQNSTIEISNSNGTLDLAHLRKRIFFASDLIDLNSEHKILHIPSTTEEELAIIKFKEWKNNLFKYSIKISTGPVVSFRAKDYISQLPTKKCVPLFSLNHVKKMELTWPLNGYNKPEYVQLTQSTVPILIPNRNYIFLRRFSAKDDKSRLIACPYFSEEYDVDLIGVENHLNYLYKTDNTFHRNELLGLCALLNSSLFDSYFRSFNGNINVSATELREMTLPTLEQIIEIGNVILVKKETTQEIIDTIVEDVLMLVDNTKKVYVKN